MGAAERWPGWIGESLRASWARLIGATGAREARAGDSEKYHIAVARGSAAGRTGPVGEGDPGRIRRYGHALSAGPSSCRSMRHAGLFSARVLCTHPHSCHLAGIPAPRRA